MVSFACKQRYLPAPGPFPLLPLDSMASTEEIQTARSYEFFRDLCQALKQRNQHFAVNPTDEKEMDAIRDRVKEDPLWILGEPPRILPIPGIEKGTVRVVEANQIQTMAQAMRSHTGLGRFQKIYMPSFARKIRH